MRAKNRADNAGAEQVGIGTLAEPHIGRAHEWLLRAAADWRRARPRGSLPGPVR
ncbi:hypothetical protein AB0M97_26395 [Streptomyces sp. NPDC051207]|uniref:hypothetical protein n=1 Tax=Streptomyces sp. NPDC051207 TaxID=3154641 RepID=UPI0034186D76